MKACPLCSYPEGLINCPICHKTSEKAMKTTSCPNKDEHTPHPLEYFEYEEWARVMLKTHHQLKCPDCGLWEIWVPKEQGAGSDPTPCKLSSTQEVDDGGGPAR